MKLAHPSEMRAPSPLDVLDAQGVMVEMLHISDSRTLNRMIAAGLPCHRGPRNKRLFIRGEVLDYLRSRCTSPVAGNGPAA